MKSDWTATVPPSNRTPGGAGSVTGDHNALAVALTEVRSFVPNSAADVGALTQAAADARYAALGGSAATRIAIPYSLPGTLSVQVGAARIYLDAAYTLAAVTAGVGTPATGSSIIADVKYDGTTIFAVTGNRPTIAAAGNVAAVGAASVTTYAGGHYLSVDVAQVGSGVSGSDLVVTVYLIKS